MKDSGCKIIPSGLEIMVKNFLIHSVWWLKWTYLTEDCTSNKTLFILSTAPSENYSNWAENKIKNTLQILVNTNILRLFCPWVYKVPANMLMK